MLRTLTIRHAHALNDGSILTINNNYGPEWRLPSGAILAARTIQIGGQLTV
jgi:hypothetical protein